MHDGLAGLGSAIKQRFVGSIEGVDAIAGMDLADPEARGRHVLVIGGAGYIGCVLTDALLAMGYHVRIV